MSSSRHNDFHPQALRKAEDTLRLIASLPAPEGLAERVQAKVRTASRRSQFLSFDFALMPGGWMYSPALRGAAAAAIVVLVAGGGWRIYSHVQPLPAAQIIVAPARIGPSGGFSAAGAMRTPDTLNGPVLTHDIVSGAQNNVPAGSGVKGTTRAGKGVKAASRKKKATISLR